MESARKRAKFDLADLIKFEPLEDPPWRKHKLFPSVSEMLKEIAQFMQKFNSLENRDTKNVDDEFLDHFIRCNVEEHEKEQQQTTFNLRKAYRYLLDFKDKPDYRQIIEESMLSETNRIILKGLVSNPDGTEPGTYSDIKRSTEWCGEVYEYQMPESGMLVAVHKNLNKFNSLYEHSQIEPDKEKKLEKLFKACSWFVFEMLDLHPFANGNGRLCRLLCSYVLSTVNPFPTPIYNFWTESSKDDYKQALVDARKSKERHPRALLTMIVECSWSGWKQYLQKLESGTEAGSSNESQDGSVASSS